MVLTIGFSPCPNDTFIFDALVNGGIELDGIRLEPVLEDVETLNQWALEGRLDITKLSFPAYFRTADKYSLLNAGSALGRGVGPLLIKGSETEYDAEAVNQARVVLPGLNTTANLLFQFAYPQARNKLYSVFHEIENMVASGEADLGVIIHENRFTYQERGLHQQMDLGTYWEAVMKVPIPLGGIVIRKSLGTELAGRVEDWIRQSLDKSYQHYPEISAYVQQHAQAMSEAVMRQHIELYVNEYTRDLGVEGREAVAVLQSIYEGRD
ncbi:1,4-dihydroxy-6-naphthoate synthase [Niabella terrae]